MSKLLCHSRNKRNNFEFASHVVERSSLTDTEQDNRRSLNRLAKKGEIKLKNFHFDEVTAFVWAPKRICIFSFFGGEILIHDKLLAKIVVGGGRRRQFDFIHEFTRYIHTRAALISKSTGPRDFFLFSPNLHRKIVMT